MRFVPRDAWQGAVSIENERHAVPCARYRDVELGYSTNIGKPMTLTDIYNQSEMGFEQGRRVGIGFRADK